VLDGSAEVIRAWRLPSELHGRGGDFVCAETSRGVGHVQDTELDRVRRVSGRRIARLQVEATRVGATQFPDTDAVQSRSVVVVVVAGQLLDARHSV
jgi:hypothetical protein